MARIVLLNDEPDLVELVEMILEQAGHDVQPFTDAADAMDKMLEAPPDLLILDWVLRDTTGEEVLRRMRRDPRSARVPVLIVSALPDGEQKARLFCADSFLAKPFNADELVRAAEELLARRGSAAAE
jgi:two-component system phosphate regulon response regulator PhoB